MISLTFEGPLALAPTLDGGQAFRWRACPGGSYEGIVNGAAVTATVSGSRLLLEGPVPTEAPFWRRYFALDLDYPGILARLSASPALRRAVAVCPGIRVLRQDYFETLVTFILSSANNIARIRGIVERLCASFGDAVPGCGRRAFPAPGALAGLSPADLAPLRAGYRVPGILDAARRVASGELAEDALAGLPTTELLARLRRIRGVGPKVAACTALFGLGRLDSFPVDTWMRRALRRAFPSGHLPRRLEPWAGIAQQYLFQWARSARIK